MTVTVTPLTMDIDITTDGEYEQHGEVKIVMTTEQMSKLSEVLDKMVDPTALEQDDPEGAIFVSMLLYAIKHA